MYTFDRKQFEDPLSGTSPLKRPRGSQVLGHGSGENPVALAVLRLGILSNMDGIDEIVSVVSRNTSSKLKT